MKSLLKILFGWVVLTGLLIGCNNATSGPTGSTASSSTSSSAKKQGQAYVQDDDSDPHVLSIAVGSKDHTTLVAAVEAAELQNSLVNAGPLMVFAPVNAAFEALPAGTLDELLRPENKDQLAYILKYHVTPGNYSKDMLKNFKKLGQANNESVEVKVEGDDVYIGGAKIVASIPASNGIIHVVDAVMLPSESM